MADVQNERTRPTGATADTLTQALLALDARIDIHMGKIEKIQQVKADLIAKYGKEE